LRTYLVGIILVAAVPLAALVTWQIISDIRQRQAALETHLQSIATAVASTVENELAASAEALKALSHAPSLQSGDLPAFRQMLDATGPARATWSGTFLLSADGKVLFDSRAPMDAGTARSGWEDWPAIARNIESGGLSVSNLIDTGDANHRSVMLAVPVAVQPATTSGAVPQAFDHKRILGIYIRADAWQSLMERSGAAKETVATLFDGHQRVIARSLRTGTRVGAPLSDGSQMPTRSMASGVRRITSPDNGESDFAWQLLERGGWGVGVAQPVATFDASNTRVVLVTLGLVGLCLLFGVTAAMLVARRVTEPVGQLAARGAAAISEPIVVDEIAQLHDGLLRAAKERQTVTDRLATKAEEFETLFRSSPLGLAFAQDSNCSVVLQNVAMNRLFPPSQGGEPLATRPRILQDGMTLEKDQLPLQRAARAGETVHSVELEIRVAGQAPTFVLASATPLWDSQGRPRGAIGAVIDITERKHAEAMLQTSQQQELSARLEAEAANRAKTEFLSMMGHELRNPLNAIATSVQVLNQVEATAPAAFSARGIIARQTKKLARMLDDLIDVGRVIADDVELMRQPLDLAAAVQRTVETMRSAAAVKAQTIALDLEEVWIDGDAQRIGQIIEKLLDNAIKFSPRGGHIDVQLTSPARSAVLRVRDSGDGIASELLAKVFDPFVQGVSTLDRHAGGLGIGLTLVKRLVELHGGTVQATSSGAGTVFEVRLSAMEPMSDANADTHANTTANAANADSAVVKHKQVVVIDDNSDALYGLCSMLTLEGHEVQTASDGTSGLSMLLEVMSDVAIVDIGLPGIDGYEVARRSRAAGYRGRLIALTGFGQGHDLQRSLAAGFEAHLVKPVDPAQLLRLLAAA
jgi:signal transduction histidine kinase/CheY-like chemotaxis protein